MMGILDNIDGVTGSVVVAKDAALAALYGGGAVGVRVADNTWTYASPNGAISTTGTTTGGMQELFNYAATYGLNVHVYGGGIRGTAYPSYDYATINCTSPLVVPNFQLRSVLLDALTLNWGNDLGSSSGLVFESCMMQNFTFHGQAVYAGNGFAVQVKPTIAVPGDGLITSVDSDIYIQTIAYIGGGTASDSSCFAIEGGALTQRVHFRLTEINGANGSTIYAKRGIYLADNVAENCTFDVAGIHHVSAAGIQNGTSTAATTKSGNTFRAGIIQPYGASAEGVSTFAPNCLFEIATDAGVGAYHRAAGIQSSANNTTLLLRQATGFTSGTAVTNNSTGSHIIGSGYFS